MRIFTKLLMASAAIATAAPAAAQYYGSYSGYSQPYAQTYGYSQPYAQTYGYSRSYGYAQPYAVNTGLATQQCSSAVQNRLYNRSSIGGILGAVLGTSTTGRVVSVTQVVPRSNGTVRVRTSDGRLLTASADTSVPADDLQEQMSRLAAKFNALAGPVLGPDPAAAVVEVVERLEDLERVGDLTVLLTAA